MKIAINWITITGEKIMKQINNRQVSSMPQWMICIAVVSVICAFWATTQPVFASQSIDEYCSDYVGDVIRKYNLNPSRKTINKAWGLCTDHKMSEAKKVLLKSPRRSSKKVRDHRNPEGVCTDRVQGKIAWDYNGNKRWAKGNVQRLCRGTSNGSQPAKCFNRVMHGGINWGGGTRWQWKNAIDLCEGTNNASMTIGCFQSKIRSGAHWQRAIGTCQTR